MTMEFKDIKPIINEPVLFIEEEKILVIADLHIGIEIELNELGLHTPSQTSSMSKRLILLINKYKPEMIILLGDVKHDIVLSTVQERADVRCFLKEISSFGSIHILPGNHDGNIHRLLNPEIHLHPSNGFAFKNIGFVHGHRWPNKDVMMCENVIIGHTHPIIMLKDRLGYKNFEPCWMRGKCKNELLKEKYPDSKNPNIIVMPTFNPICGGISINTEELIGPFNKIMNVKDSEIYLLDGSSLGKVKYIE
jgi:putative SbcD/Mre11-related phosphoesterase